MGRYEKSDPSDKSERRKFTFEDEGEPKKTRINIQEAVVLDNDQFQKPSHLKLFVQAMKYSLNFTFKLSLVLALLYGIFESHLNVIVSNYVQKQLLDDAKKIAANVNKEFSVRNEEPSHTQTMALSLNENPSLHVNASWVYDPEKLEMNAKSQLANIEIASIPAANLILLNNKKVVNSKNESIKAPLEKLLLEAGEYDLVLQNTTMGVYSKKHVKIEAKENLKLEFMLTDKY